MLDKDLILEANDSSSILCSFCIGVWHSLVSFHPMASPRHHKSTVDYFDFFQGNKTAFVKHHMNYYPMIAQSFNLREHQIPLHVAVTLWIWGLGVCYDKKQVPREYQYVTPIPLFFEILFILTLKKDINELFFFNFALFCFIFFICKIIPHQSIIHHLLSSLVSGGVISIFGDALTFWIEQKIHGLHLAN